MEEYRISAYESSQIIIDILSCPFSVLLQGSFRQCWICVLMSCTFCIVDCVGHNCHYKSTQQRRFFSRDLFAQRKPKLLSYFREFLHLLNTYYVYVYTCAYIGASKLMPVHFPEVVKIIQQSIKKTSLSVVDLTKVRMNLNLTNIYYLD